MYFRDAEGIVEQVEHAGDDVADKIRTTKADRNSNDAQAGDHRADFEADRRQRHQHRDSNHDDEQDIAENRQQCAHARPPPRLVGVRLTEILGLGEFAVDRRLCCLPQQVGGVEEDDGSAERAVDKVVNSVSSLPSTCTLKAPAPGEDRCGADDQQRPQTALEAYLDDAWQTITNPQRTGRLKEVPDRAPDREVGEGYSDDNQTLT